MKKKISDYLIVSLKGLAMGAADVVPGVSGGTIAFISGIYQELIDSINKINLKTLKNCKKVGFKKTWNEINGNFLFSLALGIGISILTLSKVITHLLENKPIHVWSFFFGLVLASIFLIGKTITQWTIKNGFSMIIGIIISYYITIARPYESPDSLLFLFLSGFLGIIAMILPGISGAFILLLIGTYRTVIGTINQLREAIGEMNWESLGNALLKLTTFALGALIGIKVFSGILHWMFEKHKNSTLALLIGFMIGSLNKIWPWKMVLETRINSHGQEVPFIEKSILPQSFEGDPKILTAIFMLILGFILIFGLEKMAQRLGRK